MTASSGSTSLRDDMRKVLTERPRAGSSYVYHDFRTKENRADYDDLPSHQGMRRPYSYNDKSFSDLLGPLRGFLYSSVGRPWNDVWSEICKAVPSGNTIDEHLKGHVRSDVDINTFIGEDGKVYANSRYGRVSEPWLFYVHPTDGTLRAVPDKPRRKYPDPVWVEGLQYRPKDGLLFPMVRHRGPSGRYPIKQIGDRVAILVEGLWYWVIFDEVPPPYRDQRGALVQPNRYDFQRNDWISKGRYHAAKAQMSSKDLRQNGLRNLT